MKIRIVLTALVAFLLLAGTAQGSWYMSYGQAKNESKAYAKELCDSLRECEAWGAGKCVRRASARFDCVVATWFPGEYAEEIECQQVLHWGVRRGYVALKNAGEPHCL